MLRAADGVLLISGGSTEPVFRQVSESNRGIRRRPITNRWAADSHAQYLVCHTSHWTACLRRGIEETLWDTLPKAVVLLLYYIALHQKEILEEGSFRDTAILT